MIFNLKTENFCCPVIVIGVFLFLWQIEISLPQNSQVVALTPNVMVLGVEPLGA
jgi:hypothetical protein